MGLPNYIINPFHSDEFPIYTAQQKFSMDK